MVVWNVKICTVSLKCLLRVFFPEQEDASGVSNGALLNAAPAEVRVELSCGSCGSVGRDDTWTSCSHLLPHVLLLASVSTTTHRTHIVLQDWRYLAEISAYSQFKASGAAV